MTTQLYNNGELAVLDGGLGSRSVDFGLYNDSTDALSDSATYADITTEPSGASYSVQTASGGSVALNGSNDGEITYSDQTFDVSDSSESVDAAYVRDSSTGDLLFAVSLDQTYDLSSVDEFVLSNTSLNLD